MNLVLCYWAGYGGYKKLGITLDTQLPPSEQSKLWQSRSLRETEPIGGVSHKEICFSEPSTQLWVWQAQNLYSRLAGWRWGKDRCCCFRLKAVWR